LVWASKIVLRVTSPQAIQVIRILSLPDRAAAAAPASK
jgi:hypothetical protein